MSQRNTSDPDESIVTPNGDLTADVARSDRTGKTRTPVPRSGELLGGRFSLRREIGRGGSGTVFEAFDTKVGQRVAVKVLHSDIGEAGQLERVRREVRASRPGHPNAVAVFDLFDDGHRRFLTMEMVEGTSLRSELAECGSLPVEATIRIGRQVSAALADLHGKGLVHRDVKPGNIMISAEGNAKLCDMGLVRSTMRGGTVTETKMVVGTPAYMAPEQALAGDLLAVSDVYALGLTMFQCLTGEVPLQEDTAVATLMLRQRSRPPRVRSLRADCSKWLSRLIYRMLDPTPQERPTAAEVERALTDQRVGLRIRPRRRHVLGALVVVLVATGSLIAYRGFSQPEAATVEAVGSDIVGYGDDGLELWRHHLDQAQAEVLRADLDGDGSDEVLVVERSELNAMGLSNVVHHSDIVILKASGKVMTQLDPETEIGRWSYRYRLEVNPILHALDLDGDGWLEVVAVCRQRRYFPTEVLVYWPRWSVWDHVLSHPGAIYNVYPPRSGSQPGFRFLGVNNRLAMYGVLGELWLVPPSQRGTAVKGRSVNTVAPPFGHLGLRSAGGLYDYVPLVPQQPSNNPDPRAIESNPDGGWNINIFNSAFVLDADLNRADGPNAGRDLRSMRESYFRLLYDARPGFRTFTSEGIATIRAEMAAGCGPLLAESPYETIFLETVGRALARVDDLEGAVDLLRPAFERLRNDDLGYRLANLEAIAGNLDSAASSLRLLMDEGGSRRAGFDAPHLMLRVAIEGREVELFDSAASFLVSLFRDSPERLDIRAALVAGARLWWDECSEADSRVRSMDYAEDGDAVGCLIRWRRGGSLQGDAGAMRIFIETNPDAAGIGQAALAAALLGNGSLAEAVEECDTAVTMIGDWSKDDFREHQNLQLVMAIRCVALLESGDRKLARKEALRLSSEVRSDLLPGILVAEVIAATAE